MANLDMSNTPDHYPQRGDQVEAWLKDRRDLEGGESPNWTTLDLLLDEYREAADTGRSLNEVVNDDEKPPRGERKPKR